jgi:O-antigen/teichoic acid export membrane protein
VVWTGGGKERKRVKAHGSLVAKNSLINFVGTAVPMVLGVATIPGIIRGLGTDRFGVLTIVWIVLGYFSLIDLGLGRAVTRFVADALGRGEEEKIPQLVWTAVALQAVLGLAGTALLVVLTPLLVGRFFNIPLHLVGETKETFYLLAFSIPVSLLSISFRGLLEATQRFDLVNLVKAPSSMATYLLPWIGVILGFSLPGIVAFLLAARVISAVVLLLLCVKVFPGLKSGFAIRGEVLRPLFVYGGWVTAANTVEPFLGHVERFLIAHLVSVGALAFYAAPCEMISKVVIFPASIAAALMPAFSFQGTNDRGALMEMFSRPAKYLLFIMTPLSVILIVFAGPILSLWLGEEFGQRSTVPFQILVVAFFGNAFAYVPYAAVYGLGRPDLKAKLNFIELPLFVAFCFLLIPGLGLAGAALAKLLLTAVDGVGLFWMAKRVSGLQARELLFEKAGQALVLSGFFILGAVLLVMVSKPLALDVLILAGLAALYLFFFLKRMMDEKDRLLFRSLQNSLQWGRRN